MKRKNFYLSATAALLLFSFLLTTTGCKKSSSSSGGGSTVSATFSGTAFQPSLVQGVDAYSILDISALQLKAGDSTIVEIDFADNAAVNTAIDFQNSEISYFDTKGLINFDSGNDPSHGTITITSWDKTNLKIAGTFTGVIYGGASGTDSVVITGGTFNTTYKSL